MARICLGLPVYNGEDYIEECLNSILAQTHEDFELAISDNASTDRTVEICRDYAAKDPRVRIFVQEENVGAANNFNFVFYDSDSEYFKWCACDDLLEPSFLEKTFARLEAEPEAVLCHSYTRIFNDETGEEELFVPAFDMTGKGPADRLWDSVRHGHRCYEVFGLIRRDALERTGLIGNHRGGDNVLLFRLSLLGPFAIVPEPLFLLRRHAKQSTALVSNSQAYQQWFTGQRQKITFPDWHFMNEAWKVTRGLDLPVGERLNCYRALWAETFKRRRRLLQNLRVAAETAAFGESDPRKRRSLSSLIRGK